MHLCASSPPCSSARVVFHKVGAVERTQVFSNTFESLAERILASHTGQIVVVAHGNPRWGLIMPSAADSDVVAGYCFPKLATLVDKLEEGSVPGRRPSRKPGRPMGRGSHPSEFELSLKLAYATFVPRWKPQFRPNPSPRMSRPQVS
jgi:hypothetical protein